MFGRLIIRENVYQLSFFLPKAVLTLALILIVSAGLSGSVALATDSMLERGKKLFKKCAHCHTTKLGAQHRIGPNLHGMFGRKAGELADFEYSPAWKNADFLWNNNTLDTYLKAPHKMIPNNLMPFDGLSRPNDREALIYYMRTIITATDP